MRGTGWGQWAKTENPAEACGVGFEAVTPNPKLKLMDQVREVLRLEAVES
jgi:hypothetical protein